MQTVEANKLIEKIQKEVLKSGIKQDKVVEQLKELRPFALKEEDPTLTKVIRLTYEHIAENGTFNIPIPADELVFDGDDDHEEVEMMENTIKTEEDSVESFNYLLSLMLDRKNPSNRQELMEYRDALKNY